MQFLKTIKRYITKKLSNKMILVFWILILILIGSLSYVIFNKYSQFRANDYISNNKSVLKIFNSDFEDYISEVSDLSLSFRNDNQLLIYMTYPADDYDSQSYIESNIRMLFYSREDIEQLEVFLPSNQNLYSISRKEPYIRIETMPEYTNSEWYNDTIKKNTFNVIEPYYKNINKYTEADKNNPLLYFHRAIIDIQTKKPICMVSFLINYKKSTIFYNKNISSDEIIALINTQNEVFFYNNNIFANLISNTNFYNSINFSSPNGDFNIQFDGIDYQVIYDISPTQNWVMIKLIPQTLIKKGARELLKISILFGLIFILVSIPLIAYISKIITMPLKRMAINMDKISDGNFNILNTVKGNDEIAMLANRFNSMTHKIRNLIRDKYEAQASENNARIKALEAQVNPHFLYNSLQAIASESLKNGATYIYDLIIALSSNIRYSIKGSAVVTIDEEVSFLKNYCLIQKARFKDRLKIEYDIENSVMKTLIPKMSIQVLVENAIIHGIEVTTKKTLITIKAVKNKKSVILSIADNGIGISRNELDQIQKNLNDSSWMDNYNQNMGIVSVSYRLKQLYNGKSTVIITSEEGRGTQVELVIPVEGDNR